VKTGVSWYFAMVQVLLINVHTANGIRHTLTGSFSGIKFGRIIGREDKEIANELKHRRV